MGDGVSVYAEGVVSHSPGSQAQPRTLGCDYERDHFSYAESVVSLAARHGSRNNAFGVAEVVTEIPIPRVRLVLRTSATLGYEKQRLRRKDTNSPLVAALGAKYQ